jgi:hypothetical protein
MHDSHQAAREACYRAGVVFVGVQRCYGIRSDILLFQPYANGTTLAVPLDSPFLPQAIAYKIDEQLVIEDEASLAHVMAQ